MKQKPVCPQCGASIARHGHTLSYALVVALAKLAEWNKPVNLKVLKLTRNQWDNFQKLRYWEFVKKARRTDGKRIGGVWAITEEGHAFLQGRTFAFKKVRTYRGERVRFEGPLVRVTDVVEGYRYRPDYAADMEPHFEEDRLF